MRSSTLETPLPPQARMAALPWGSVKPMPRRVGSRGSVVEKAEEGLAEVGGEEVEGLEPWFEAVGVTKEEGAEDDKAPDSSVLVASAASASKMLLVM